MFQVDPSTNDRLVIAYTSSSLTDIETRYTVTQKEALTILHALRQWRVFVLGRPLMVITDHKALSFQKDYKLLNARLTRWILFLQEFNFKILHCEGKENEMADVLSRFPCDRVNSKVEYTKNERFHIEAITSWAC